MARLNQKISGSTLLETLVALIIIILVLGVGINIYLKTLKSGNEIVLIEVRDQFHQIAYETKAEKLYSNDRISAGSYFINKSVRVEHNARQDLVYLELSALDLKGKLIAEYRQIILADED